MSSSTTSTPVVPQRRRAYGWVPDAPDSRDNSFVHFLAREVKESDIKDFQAKGLTDKLPPAVRLEQSSKDQLPIYDQFGLGSCTANAVLAALRYAWKQDQQVNKKKNNATYSSFDPSRLWVYYYGRTSRFRDNRPDVTKYNEGMSIRDAMKLLNEIHVCSEKAWAYPSEDDGYQTKKDKDPITGKEIEVFDDKYLHKVTEEPDANAKADVPKFWKPEFQFEYLRIRTSIDSDLPANITKPLLSEIDLMRACIAEGYPVVYGFSIYKNAPFGWRADLPEYTGVPNPFLDNEKKPGGARFMDFPTEGVIGKFESGHAVLAIGFDHEKKVFLCQNSWGITWKKGDLPGGLFWMPYSWFDKKNVTYDLWTIRPKNTVFRTHRLMM
ncbi:hypothetical protein QBC38DRAFT_494123 [Podospora fimiseda]|uniref:Cysteine protease n=1 Tax=Podospora fimiseda TaxID=252190 RepID=A0AAN6YPM5_9PEZI|nr:hypothetical protein QBC38DRAFT_494123 [Podospora fimiseda]